MSGVYAAAPSPVLTICPAEAVTDALKVYGGVVYVGVAMAMFGRVVAMVADWDERKAAIWAADSTVALGEARGYRPILGASALFIP